MFAILMQYCLSVLPELCHTLVSIHRMYIGHGTVEVYDEIVLMGLYLHIVSHTELLTLL